MDRMQILLTASSPGVGLTFHVSRLAIFLERRGHNVTVISDTKEENEGLSDELRSEVAEYHKVGGLDDYFSLHSVWQLGRILKGAAFDIAHVYGLIKLAKFYSARWLFDGKKEPIILHMDSIRDEAMIRKIGYTAFRRILNSHVDVIVVVSDWTKKRLHMYGVAEDKMITVHNAIDLEWFDSVASMRPPSSDFFDGIKDKTVVTQVSTLYPWKGHKYLLRAARKVLAINPDVHFLIVGGGPLKQELESLAHSFGISKEVTFAGHVQNYYIPWILSNIDIGVLASLRENCPRALLEYMAAKKPVVATEVGGVPEVVAEGINGYLVPPGNSNLLACAILKLVDNDQAARKMSIEGRRVVEEELSMNVFSSRLESIYELARRNGE